MLENSCIYSSTWTFKLSSLVQKISLLNFGRITWSMYVYCNKNFLIKKGSMLKSTEAISTTGSTMQGFLLDVWRAQAVSENPTFLLKTKPSLTAYRYACKLPHRQTIQHVVFMNHCVHRPVLIINQTSVKCGCFLDSLVWVVRDGSQGQKQELPAQDCGCEDVIPSHGLFHRQLVLFIWLHNWRPRSLSHHSYKGKQNALQWGACSSWEELSIYIKS